MEALLALVASKGGALLLAGIAGPFAPVIASFLTKSRLTVYLCLACAAAGGIGGWYVTLQFWRADERAAVLAVQAFKDVKFHTVTKVERVVTTKLKVIHERGKEVIRYVDRVISPKVEAACPGGLPVGFVRLHDAAAANEPGLLSGGPSGSDERPSGVTLARAGGVVSENYEEYNACRAQVVYWNRFYDCLRTSGSTDAADRCVDGVPPTLLDKLKNR